LTVLFKNILKSIKGYKQLAQLHTALQAV